VYEQIQLAKKGHRPAAAGSASSRQAEPVERPAVR